MLIPIVWHNQVMKIGIGTAIALAIAMVGLGVLPLGGRVTPHAVHGPATASQTIPSSEHGRIQRGGSWVRTRLTAWTNALLQDPRQAGRLVAGTANGVWLSPDNGATWRRGNRGLSQTSILALAATPASHAIFAGAADGAVYVGQAQHGAAWGWQRISPRLGPDPIFSLAVSAHDGATALAGTTGALYRGENTDTGWLWRRVARVGDAAITSIAWAPWDARLVFASVFASTPPVLLTRDAGRTWHASTTGLPAILPTETLLPLAGPTPRLLLSTMGGGVWQRSSAGRWRDVSTGLPERHAMFLVADLSGGVTYVYAGTMGFGVYAAQGTAPWRRLGRGLSGASYTVLALALTSGPHPTLFAATAHGVFRYVPPA